MSFPTSILVSNGWRQSICVGYVMLTLTSGQASLNFLLFFETSGFSSHFLLFPLFIFLRSYQKWPSLMCSFHYEYFRRSDKTADRPVSLSETFDRMCGISWSILATETWSPPRQSGQQSPFGVIQFLLNWRWAPGSGTLRSEKSTVSLNFLVFVRWTAGQTWQPYI